MRLKSFGIIVLALSLLLLSGCGGSEDAASEMYIELNPGEGLSYFYESVVPQEGSIVLSVKELPKDSTVYVCLFNELFPDKPILEDELRADKLQAEFSELSSAYSYKIAAGLIGGDKSLKINISYR